jgi:hypothetical protein
MSTVLRTWLASIALCFSALVLTADADPQFLGTRAMLALVIVFSHAWILAVTERACPARGGVDIPRFALGPRLLSIRPGLIAQCLVPVMMLGVVTRSTLVLGLGVAVVFVLTTDALRQSLIWVIPVCAAVMGLLTMDEFHVLSDLMTSAKEWLGVGLTISVWALILGGTLLRTDVAAIKPKGQLIAFLASVPGYLGAFYIMTRTGLAGTQPGILGVAVVLLAGGLVQTVVVGFLAHAADITPRTAAEFPRVQAGSVGMGVLPLLLCVTALLGMALVTVGARGESLAGRQAWVGLMALSMLIPLVPAAALVASGLDRVDGRGGSHRNRRVALGALGAWLVAGPMALSWIYAPNGPISQLSTLFPSIGGWKPIVSASGASSVLGGTALGGDLVLFGLPAADMCRAATLMVGSVALYSAGLVRHAACGLKGTSWGTLGIALGLQLAGIVFLQPRLGPAGAAVVTAAVCLLMLIIDARIGEEVEDSEEAVCEFDGLLDAVVVGESVEDNTPVEMGIGLSIEPAPQIVPDKVPAPPGVFEVDWVPHETIEDAEIPDPFEESFRGKKGTPIEPDPEVSPTIDAAGGEFAIDQLPDDPFFASPTDSVPPVPPGPPLDDRGNDRGDDRGRESEDDSEPSSVRL